MSHANSVNDLGGFDAIVNAPAVLAVMALLGGDAAAQRYVFAGRV